LALESSGFTGEQVSQLASSTRDSAGSTIAHHGPSDVVGQAGPRAGLRQQVPRRAADGVALLLLGLIGAARLRAAADARDVPQPAAPSRATRV